MIPDPLHPALVHFPIVFMALLPLVAVGALWAIRRGTAPRRAWAFPLALAAVLAVSARLAVQTGEAQEDRVERVVTEAAMHDHEEAGERFFLLSVAVLAVIATGMLRGKSGALARGAGLVAALGLGVAGYQVGRSGGDLVYRHGAAAAYTTESAATEAGDNGSSSRDDGRRRGRSHDDDDES